MLLLLPPPCLFVGVVPCPFVGVVPVMPASERKKVRILRLLQHSNVVTIYQFFEDDPDYYYMVLENMAGGELFDRIVQKVGDMTERENETVR